MVDGQCIQVAHPGHLYLVGERLVPTHNTVTLASALAWRTLYDPACLNFYATFGDELSRQTSRLVRRLGLTSNHDPVKVERDLMALIPMEEWTIFSHRLIWFGREVCSAKDPRCDRCELADLCPSAFKVGRFVKAAKATRQDRARR